MTFQHNCVWPITSLFEVLFKNYLHKWSPCWVDMTFQQNSFRHITLWFEVKFYNYFTGMATILRQRVACNIWVATLKAKVTASPASKSCLAQNCFLKSDFTTTFDKLLLCVQYLFGEHYPVQTGSCFVFKTHTCKMSPLKKPHITKAHWALSAQVS